VTVVVIAARQVRNLRSRYGAAGNKDDRLRRTCCAPTGRGCAPVIPDRPKTVALRQTCLARTDLVRHRRGDYRDLIAGVCLLNDIWRAAPRG
jgi:transposase